MRVKAGPTPPPALEGGDQDEHDGEEVRQPQHRRGAASSHPEQRERKPDERSDTDDGPGLKGGEHQSLNSTCPQAARTKALTWAGVQATLPLKSHLRLLSSRHSAQVVASLVFR